MQSAQDFIRDYLKEQVRLQEVWSEAWLPVRQRFFQPGYNAFDPQRNIDRAKAEVPLAISESEGVAVVTTSGYGEGHRLRYTLQETPGAWRTSRIELECGICRGSGKCEDRECKLCEGKGWKLF
jgi:hypothetical protein